MARKIPESTLQALHDALQLLELLSTAEKPFDDVQGVAQQVGWHGMLRMVGRMRQAMRWLESQAKNQRYRFKRNDIPEAPERRYASGTARSAPTKSTCPF